MPRAHWSWTIPTNFSQGWRCGDFVFVGGQVSADERGRPIGIGDMELQTRNALTAVSRVLEEAGSRLDEVVKLNTFYVQHGDGDEVRLAWERLTQVRQEFFSEPGPCGTAVRCTGLAFPGLLVEIEAIAYSPRPAGAPAHPA
jgi:enamine deaminase RidA (YjgF/YER057c/UK114 family)